MGAKTEISWKRRTDDGERLQVYASRSGTEWSFHHREKRYDQWRECPKPPLEDWLALLDGVERRVQRRLLRPEEAERVRRRIHELFPDAELD